MQEKIEQQIENIWNSFSLFSDPESIFNSIEQHIFSMPISNQEKDLWHDMLCQHHYYYYL
jgi:hypothetical protein